MLSGLSLCGLMRAAPTCTSASMSSSARTNLANYSLSRASIIFPSSLPGSLSRMTQSLFNSSLFAPHTSTYIKMLSPGGGPGGAGNGIDFPDNVEHPHLYPTVRTLSLSSLCERLPASCVEPSTCACRRAHVCGVRFSVPGSGHASATPCLVFLNPKSGSGPVSAPPFLIFLDAFSRGRRAHSLACSVSCVFVRVCVCVCSFCLSIFWHNTIVHEACLLTNRRPFRQLDLMQVTHTHTHTRKWAHAHTCSCSHMLM